MKKLYIISLLFSILLVLCIPNVFACFGDKLGIAHLKGAGNEFAAQLVAIYIKEKTGIGSVVNEFNDDAAVERSFKKDKTDIIVMTGKADLLDIDRLAGDNADSRFFTLIDGNGQKIVLRVSKTRLDDMKFFTLNKVMNRIGRVITADDFNNRVGLVKAGEKFPKEAALEYLKEKDLI